MVSDTPQPSALFVTPGEPAGIGSDLLLQIAGRSQPAPLIAVADPELLAERAQALKLHLELTEIVDGQTLPAVHQPGVLPVLPVRLQAPVVAGELNPANAAYVLKTLEIAVGKVKRFGALVTGPVHKGVINEGGIPFTGHTEFLAQHAGGTPVMLLATPRLRVALATTHMPLRRVADSLNRRELARTLRIVDGDFRRRFGIPQPRILVTGLNPHAGEDGHLGREELDVIIPVVRELRAEGLAIEGPVPADTAFTPQRLDGFDVVLTMYHDQGLPVLKALGFGEAVNVTLGLPIIRTSVDHGTALELAGSGRAKAGSLQAAVSMAAQLAGRK